MKTAETIAARVIEACTPHAPARGYTGAEYVGARRLETIARMVEALHGDGTRPASHGQFREVCAILENDNCHTENVAFCLAHGNAADILDALQAVHYMGQSYACENGLQYPQTIL